MKAAARPANGGRCLVERAVRMSRLGGSGCRGGAVGALYLPGLASAQVLLPGIGKSQSLQRQQQKQWQQRSAVWTAAVASCVRPWGG